MICHHNRALLLVAIGLFVCSIAIAQTQNSNLIQEHKLSLDFCPLSPVFKIYAIHYGYRITPKSEIIVGPYYANIHSKNIGHTNAPGFIVGYRQ